MPSSKPKPSEVAAETKRHYIPVIRRDYAHQWPTHSYLFQQPLEQIHLPSSMTGFAPSPTEFCGCPSFQPYLLAVLSDKLYRYLPRGSR